MTKKILLLVILILLIGGGVFLYRTSKKQPEITTTVSKPTSEMSTELSSLSNDWTTYTSPEWGFMINKPFDVKTELTQNGVHFLKLGPTQSQGTELFDGLSLLIFTSKLPGSSLENFAQKEYSKAKSEPMNTVSELQKAKVSNFNGYSFTTDGMGKSTTFYLSDGSDGYIKIVDMTVEPAQNSRDFHKTVAMMLQTLQMENTSKTSADNAPSGSLHNLPVPKAVQATKDFASHDLNVPIGNVIVMSAFEKEWSNSCLGLEQEGEMCTQAVTPGYQITIQAGGKEKIYRTNADGSIIKIEK